MKPIEHFLRSAKRYPHKIALRGPEGSLSYSELAREVKACAAAFQALVPDERGRIAILARNDFAHVVALLGIMLAGRVWVPLNYRSGDAELKRAVDFVEPALIITEEDFRFKLPKSTQPILTCSHGKYGQGTCELTRTIKSFARHAPIPVNHPLSETQAIKFTGGTTGAPKGVMQSYRSWNAGIVSFLAAMGLDEQERFLAVASISHGTSTFLLPVFSRGGTVVFPSSTQPRELLEILEHERITATFMPPTLVYSLLEDPTVRQRDWSSLRHFIYAAAPMREEQITEAQQVFGPMETTYGQTECPAIISYLTADEARDASTRNSVGRPALMTDVAILDSSGNPVAQGNWGEIAVRGDLVMSGYWKQPEKTSQAFKKGWLLTGDGGYMDERGYIFLKDRIKDMIITGGFNVYPTDVEEALGSHPSVFDCSVIGIEDAKWGEAVHAAVQLRAGQQATERDLIDWVRQRLDGVKTPKRIHLLKNLPRTANSKIAKKDIRKEIEKRLTESKS